MFLIILCGILLLDQVSKICVWLFLKPQSIVPVINNVFYLNYVETDLWPFALLSGSVWIPSVFIGILLVLIAYFTYISKRLNRDVKYCIALILGGAFSNLIDTIRLGYVIDYFDISIIPVFNIADLSVAAGAIVLTFIMLFNKQLVKEDSV